jgi:hypothetical protein
VVEPENDADEKEVELKNDAEIIVKDISFAFNSQKTELVELAPIRIINTLTEYTSNNNTLDIDVMVEEELVHEKEVLVLEGQKQKA